MRNGRPQFVLHPLCLAMLFAAKCVSAQAEPASQTGVPDQPAAESGETDLAPELKSLKNEPLDWVRGREYQKQKPRAPLPERLNFCRGVFVEPDIPHIPLPSLNGESNTHASADRYAFDPEGRSLLEGNVVMRRGDEHLESQRVYYYKNENRAELEGDVQMRRPGMLIVGDRAEINMNDNTGVFYDTQYVIHSRQLHGSADQIRSNADGSLALENGFFTSCEPGHENWNLTGSTISLDKKSGWGTATNARLEIEDIPVFYTPYARFPIDERRHTGLLLPTFNSSSAGGFEYSQPIYLNLAPNYDATVTPHFIEKRGNLVETEFRYLTDQIGRGEFGLAHIKEDSVYGDKRSLFTWRHYDEQQSRWTSQARYTYVSDPAYFEDLTTDLSTAVLPHLERIGETEYRGDDWSFLARVQGYQTIDQDILENNRPLPYRRLPQLSIDASLPSEAFNGWEYLLRTEYTYFDYPDEDQPMVSLAHRVRLEPGLRYRWEKPWGYVSPTAKVRYAAYQMYAEDGLISERNPSRTVPMFSLDSGVYFDRNTRFRNGPATHTLEPRAFYLYSARRDQNEFPLFDTADLTFNYTQLFREDRFIGGDRVGDANQLALGFTSRLIEDRIGRERFRFSMGQIQYFEDREVQLTTGLPAATNENSALAAENLIALADKWDWGSSVEWNSDDNIVNQFSTRVHYQLGFDRIFNVGYNYISKYRYNDEARAADQTDISFLWPTSSHWSIIGRWIYDYNKERSNDTLGGVQYDSCCWSARLIGRSFIKPTEAASDADPQPTDGIYLQFEFKGLAGVGNANDTMISDTVFGFIPRDKRLRDSL